MEISEIVTLVTNVGFPIVCCGVLFKLQGGLNETLKELSVTLGVMNERIDNIESALTKDKTKNGDSL